MSFVWLNHVNSSNHLLHGGQDRTNPLTAVRGGRSAMRPFARLHWTLVNLFVLCSSGLVWGFQYCNHWPVKVYSCKLCTMMVGSCAWSLNHCNTLDCLHDTRTLHVLLKIVRQSWHVMSLQFKWDNKSKTRCRRNEMYHYWPAACCPVVSYVACASVTDDDDRRQRPLLVWPPTL